MCVLGRVSGLAAVAVYRRVGAALSVLVPEEVLSLGELLLLCVGGSDGLQGIGMVAGVEHLGRDGHRRRGEVLYLFEPVAQLSGEVCQLCHVCLGTAWVA